MTEWLLFLGGTMVGVVAVYADEDGLVSWPLKLVALAWAGTVGFGLGTALLELVAWGWLRVFGL